MNKSKLKPCGSHKTHKSIRSLRYCWNVYMRELSFLGSFPQTSAHTRPGRTTKPLAWCAHMCIRTCTQMSTNTSTGTCLCATTLLAKSRTIPINFHHASYFSFQLYFMLLHTTRDPLHRPSGNPTITVKQWTFHGSTPSVETNCYIFHSSEINGPPGSFHQSPSFRPL